MLVLYSHCVVLTRKIIMSLLSTMKEWLLYHAVCNGIELFLKLPTWCKEFKVRTRTTFVFTRQIHVKYGAIVHETAGIERLEPDNCFSFSSISVTLRNQYTANLRATNLVSTTRMSLVKETIITV